MRTTFFTTQLQATSGHVHVLSTHQMAGIVQSADHQDSVQSHIETLHAYLTNEPPHTPTSAKHVLQTYASEMDVAILVHKDNTLLLASHGSGLIFLKRNGKIIELVSDGHVAQGPAVSGDEFILTSDEFLDLLSGIEGFQYYFLTYSSTEVVEMMKTYEDQSIASGFVAVTFGASHKSTDSQKHEAHDAQQNPVPPYAFDHNEESGGDDTSEEGEEIEDNMLVQEQTSHSSNNVIADILLKAKYYRAKAILFIKKRLKLLVVITVFLSVILYLVIRNFTLEYGAGKKTATSISLLKSQIEAILRDADTASFADINNIEPLIASAREKLGQVSANDKRRYAEEIQQLADSITQKEKEYLKITDAQISQHFVAMFESKNATIHDADFDGEYFYLLDNKNGAIYKGSTKNRSYETIKSDKLKGALAIAASSTNVYVLTASDGIYLVTEDRSTQVIKKNPNWGTITDIRWYAGNLYILDSKRKNIYKYQGVDERTFGDEVTYLVEESQGNLESNTFMTIDGSVYAGGSSNIIKFITGRKADFNLTLPYKTYEISALYTSPDTEMLYVFDNTHKALVELNKSGVFEKQWLIPKEKVIFAGITKEGKKFVVTNTSILSLE